MAVSQSPTTITIAPLDEDEEDQDIITCETPGRTSGDVGSQSPSVSIKTEPTDTISASKTITVAPPGASILASLLPRTATTNTMINISPQPSLMRNIVSVSRGVLRFSSNPVTVTARGALGGRAAASQSQPMILIPTSTRLQQSSPFKLIPIQAKKSQAVVAPQAKQTVVVQATNTQTVPSAMREGIIWYSPENPGELTVGRSEATVVNQKRSVAGMVFTSRTVTAGGRVKYTKAFLCNLCKHMSETMVTFRLHFSNSHMFLCDYCSYKAYSRYEVVLHTKSSHTEAGDDLKGYDMFDNNINNPITVSLVPVTTASTLATTLTTAVTRTATPGTSLIKIPVRSSTGEINKVIIHPVTSSTSGTSTSTTASVSSPIVASSSSPDQTQGDSYFTYKIVTTSSGIQMYECDLCQYRTPELNTIYEHASSHSMSDLSQSNVSSTTWECFYCKFKAAQQTLVVKHVTTAHPNKNIQLKRYTSTTVVKPNSHGVAAVSGNKTPPVTPTSSIPSTNIATSGKSLIIQPNPDLTTTLLVSTSVGANAAKNKPSGGNDDDDGNADVSKSTEAASDKTKKKKVPTATLR